MKLLLTFALFALVIPFTANAQTTTNITVKWTVSYVTATNTNTVTATMTVNPGTTAKDTNRGLGLTYAYQAYTNSLGTNYLSAVPFETWNKQTITALVDGYSSQQQAASNAVLAQKITTLLTSESDLLSGSDLTSLNTIAAKAQ